MRGRSTLALLVSAALACGGQVLEKTATEVLGTPAGDDCGPDASVDSGSDSASSSGGDDGAGDGADGGGEAEAGADAMAPVSCKLTGQGGSSGGMVQDVQWVEACSDGRTHSVDCWCPNAVCCCGALGPCSLDGGGVPFPDCNGTGWGGDAGESAAWAACGYPQPN